MLLAPPYETRLKNGPLALMFEQGENRARMLREGHGISVVTVIARLHEAVRNYIPNTHEQEIYIDTIIKLHRSFYAVFSHPPADIDNTDIFSWLFFVSDDYMVLLKRQEPHAVAIFICFSHLITRLQSLWWAKGWGEWIVSRLQGDLSSEEVLFTGKLMELLVQT
jgi:hypothetical protein